MALRVGPVTRRVSANRRVAVPAAAAAAAKLERRLIELRRVRLMGVSAAMRPCHRDVDRIKYRNGSMHHGSLEGAVATGTCAVVTCRDGAGPARSEGAAGASADGRVVVAAIASDSRDLGCRLIESRDVGLVRDG